MNYRTIKVISIIRSNYIYANSNTYILACKSLYLYSNASSVPFFIKGQGIIKSPF